MGGQNERKKDICKIEEMGKAGVCVTMFSRK